MVSLTGMLRKAPAPFAVLLCAGVLLGCEAQPRAAAWLTFTRTGGIADRRDAVEVTTDRRAAVTVGARHLTEVLTAADFAALRAEVQRARLAPVPAQRGVPGRDAYTYTVTYAGRTVRFADPVPDGWAPLVARLAVLSG